MAPYGFVTLPRYLASLVIRGGSALQFPSHCSIVLRPEFSALQHCKGRRGSKQRADSIHNRALPLVYPHVMRRSSIILQESPQTPLTFFRFSRLRSGWRR